MSIKSVLRFSTLSLFLWMFASQVSALTPTEIDMLMTMSPDQQQKLIGLAQKRPQLTAVKPKTDTSVISDVDAKKTANNDVNNKPVVDLLLKAGDSIIVSFEIKEDIKLADLLYEPAQKQILYTLDKEGFISIPAVGRIELEGLSEIQAAARINIEPLLQAFTISVLHLPYKDSEILKLKPYGYEMFRQDPSTMKPETFLPVPDSYVVGPGDQIHIQLVGKENNEYLLEISRDSTLLIPGIGSIPVSGQTFKELKNDLKKRVKRQLIGVEAFVTMGELRSIQVFVLGEVERPGSYSVNALSTMTHALLHANGIKDLGSIRNITLKRQGKIIGKLDLYDLLNEGSTANDLRLSPGDVIHIPPKTSSISITGIISRPAVYELKKEKTLSEVIKLAGGVAAEADIKKIQVERIINNENKLFDIDYSTEFGQNFEINNGDKINVNSVLDRQQNIVLLKGEVINPGKFGWKPNMRISDLISDLRILKPDADTEYVVVKRYKNNGYNISVNSVSIRKALLNPESEENIALQALDEIYVLSLDANRTLQIKPVLDQMINQTVSSKQIPVVKVSGQVKGPGKYPLEEGMRISDLILAGGRLLESAYTFDAELTRFASESGQTRKVEHIDIDLDAVLNGDQNADLLLYPHDLLNIKEIPLWSDDETVDLFGEVQFPGKYAIRRGESLYQLLQRAGGLTEFAYPEGSVFIREDLRKREQERLDTMAKNLESELAAIALQRSGDPTQVTDIGSANSLLSQIKSTAAAGRLVIDLRKIASGEMNDKPIILRNHDQLFIPSLMQEVSVIGQVFHPTSHLHKENLRFNDYINLSGGMTQKAAEDNIYVVRANGAVQSASIGWNDEEVAMYPGDTIVVPLDAERVSKLKLWTSISQIVYQLGLSAAAWNTVGLFK